jgi:hypothetical protein
MSVTLMLFLFGKPGQELEEGGEVTPEQLRGLSQELQARLEQAADTIEKLTAAGWDAQMLLYDIALSNEYVKTAVQAEEILLNLGIDPKSVCIDEWEDEEEDFEEGDFGEDEERP